MRLQIAVCGPSDCTDEEHAAAYEVGVLLANRGATVICGGGPGVMAAVAAGVRAAGGTVIGILPGRDPSSADPDLSAVIATNMGEARNAIIVASADAVIAVGGSWGTLSEIALAARRADAPVVCLNGWQIVDRDGVPVPGTTSAATPQEAVDKAVSSPAGEH
jgi:uncharacterized protein (TIGR00725 family)